MCNSLIEVAILLPSAQYAQKGYAIDHVSVCMCVCVHVANYHSFDVFLIKILSKSIHGVHFGLYIMNVKVNCWFTPS